MTSTIVDRRPVSGEWDEAAAAPARGACLHELIEEQARRTPDAPAVVFEEQVLSYAELDGKAEQLAGHLRARGVGPDVRVGLFVERSAEAIVGLLGILKAGGAYVPIDAAYPRDRIAFMLADADAALVLTQDSLLAALPADRPPAIALDAFDGSASDGAPGSGAGVQPGHLAYVIYTSGSTGRPKGVGIEHKNIVNYVRGVVERLRLEGGMSFATVSTIAADLGHTVVFPALATGGCLHVLSRERAESQALLSDYFDRHPIDVLKIVPSHLAALQSGADPARLMPRKRLVLGGEASRLDWIEGLRASSPGCEIFNHYGPTEATVGVLTYAVGIGAATHAVGHAAPGPAAAEQRRPHPRWERAAGVAGRDGRAVHRRGRDRARVPEPPRADRREVRPRSGAARGTALPHGRPGALPARRQPRVLRPDGPPGQAPRPPRRARRDRAGAARRGRCP